LDSPEALTNVFYNLPQSPEEGQEKERRSLRECIYVKAWELRQSMERAERFEPFVYRAKQ